MTERKPTLQECAMRYGTGMGLLWSFKFMLFPLGLRIPFLLLLFIVLTLGVPILGYIFAKKYRERYCNNAISFGKALLFTIFMYMFASQFKTTAQAELLPSIDQLQEAFDMVAALTPLQITFQLISNNIFYGMLIAIPTALLIMRKPKNQ